MMFFMLLQTLTVHCNDLLLCCYVCSHVLQLLQGKGEGRERRGEGKRGEGEREKWKEKGRRGGREREKERKRKEYEMHQHISNELLARSSSTFVVHRTISPNLIHFFNPLFLTVVFLALSLQIFIQCAQPVNNVLVCHIHPVHVIIQKFPRDRLAEGDVQLRTVGGQRVLLVVVDQGHD